MAANPSVMTPLGDEGVVLSPATYWIELEFDRPTPKETVLEALDSMGFVDVTLDQDTAPRGGLARFGATFSASATQPAFSSASTTFQPAIASAVSIKPLGGATPSPTPVFHPSQSVTASPVAAVPSPVFHPSASIPIGPAPVAQAPAVQRAVAAAASATTQPYIPPSGNGGGGGGGGDDAAPAPDAGPAPTTSDQPYFVDPKTGLQYFMGADGQPYAVDPQTGQHLEVDPQTGMVIQSVGSGTPGIDFPMGEDPAWSLATDKIQGGVVDEICGTSPYVFRFVARMPYTIALSNRPGIFWKSVRTLTLDPWAAIDFSVRPFPLLTNRTYELRFMSRDKKAKMRGDVQTLLQAMGFDPSKLILFRRNVRIPKRPNVSVSEWLAVAKWQGPRSVTTYEDPFFFAEAREVSQ